MPGLFFGRGFFSIIIDLTEKLIFKEIRHPIKFIIVVDSDKNILVPLFY